MGVGKVDMNGDPRSTRSSTVWIDLTDLRLWSGHLTGIQRTVVRVSRHLSDRAPVAFFAYDFGGRRLVAAEPTLNGEGLEVDPAPRRVRVARSLALRVQRRPHARGLPPGWLRERPGSRAAAPPFAAGDTLLLAGNVWDQPGLQAAVARARATSGLRVAHAIYDLIPIHGPQWFERTLVGRYARFLVHAIELSDLLLTISQSTARDLEAFAAAHDLRCPPVTIIRPGDELTAVAARPPADVPPPGTFALTVGTLEARKNPALLYATWRLAREHGVELPGLVLAGRPGWGADDAIAGLMRDPALRGQVIVLSDTDDAGLRWLYENCRFTLFPSIYEGWGLPVAESLRHGKMCLASRASSIPEVGGDLIEYFSPFDAAECLALVRRHMDDGVLRAAERRIVAGYRPWSWAQTASQIEVALAGAG